MILVLNVLDQMMRTYLPGATDVVREHRRGAPLLLSDSEGTSALKSLKPQTQTFRMK